MALPVGDGEISELVLRIKRNFEGAARNFQPHLSQPEPSTLAANLDNEIQRFDLWCRNLGAFQAGHASLEYRLRDAPKVYDYAARLLKDLDESIVSVFQELSKDNDSKPSDHDLDLERVDDEFLDDESDDDEFLESYDSKSLLEILLESISSAIDRLYRLSFKIRNPATRFNLSKVLNYQDIDDETKTDILSYYVDFDRSHVREVVRDLRASNLASTGLSFLKAEEPIKVCAESADSLVAEEKNDQGTPKADYSELDSDFLVRRLAHANNIRRRQFRYWQSHQRKLAAATPAIPTSIAHTESPLLPLPRQEIVSIQPPVSLPTTVATKLKELDVDLEDTRSRVSSATYALMQKEYNENDMIIPPFPKWLEGKKEFQCPYCHIMCPASMGKKSAWETHVLRDLRPYVCTFRDCDHADQLFDTFQSWCLHESQVHIPEDAAGSHGAEHDVSIPGNTSRPTVLTVKREHFAEYARETHKCPICLKPAVSAAHIGAHLQRIAVFALPNIQSSAETPDEESNQAVRAAELETDSDSTSSKQHSLPPPDSLSTKNHDTSTTSPWRLSDLKTQDELAKTDVVAQYLSKADHLEGEPHSALIDEVPDRERLRNEIVGLKAEFQREWRPRCLELIEKPPPDRANRTKERKGLEDAIRRAILLPLEDCEVWAYSDLRKLRTKLLIEITDFLRSLHIALEDSDPESEPQLAPTTTWISSEQGVRAASNDEDDDSERNAKILHGEHSGLHDSLPFTHQHQRVLDDRIADLLDIIHTLEKNSNSTPDNEVEWLHHMKLLADAYLEDHHSTAAIEVLEKILSIQFLHSKSESELRAYLETLKILGQEYLKAGRQKEFINLYEDFIKTSKEDLGEFDEDRLACMAFLGMQYCSFGLLEKGISLLEFVLNSRDHLKEHKLGFSLASELAQAYGRLNQHQKCITILEKEVELRKHTAKSNDPTRLRDLEELARAYQAGNRLDDATRIFREVIEYRTQVSGVADAERLYSMLELAHVLSLRDEHEEMIRLLEPVSSIREQLSESAFDMRLRCMNVLAKVCRTEGLTDKLVGMWERVFFFETDCNRPPKDLLRIRQELADVYHHNGNFENEIHQREKILQFVRFYYGQISSSFVDVILDLARAYRAGDQHGDAITLLEEAVEIGRRDRRVDILEELAEAFECSGQTIQAIKIWEEVADLRKESWDGISPVPEIILPTLSRLVHGYQAIGDAEKAATVQEEIRKLSEALETGHLDDSESPSSVSGRGEKSSAIMHAGEPLESSETTLKGIDSAKSKSKDKVITSAREPQDDDSKPSKTAAETRRQARIELEEAQLEHDESGLNVQPSRDKINSERREGASLIDQLKGTSQWRLHSR